MISVSGKIWTEQKVNKNLVEKFKQDYGFSDILSKLIISRNYNSSEIYGINFDGDNFISETLVTHKNTNFKKIVKSINLINE